MQDKTPLNMLQAWGTLLLLEVGGLFIAPVKKTPIPNGKQARKMDFIIALCLGLSLAASIYQTCYTLRYNDDRGPQQMGCFSLLALIVLHTQMRANPAMPGQDTIVTSIFSVLLN